MNIEETLRKAADYEEIEDFESAENIYTKILAKEITRPRIFAFRGYCRFCMKDYFGAIDDFNSALALKSDAASTLFCRAQSFEKIGRLEEALGDYIASAKLSPEADAFMNIGMILHYKGRACDGNYYLNKALELDPKNETIVNLLAQLESGRIL